MFFASTIVIMILFAVQAIRAKRLINSALWLAGVSALLSIVLFMFGAHRVAVFELSVGAGLVTVLFVFAIGIAGEDTVGKRSIIPIWLAGGFTILLIVVIGWLILPSGLGLIPEAEPSLTNTLWQQRGLDVLVQVGLIFAGVLGLLGLLAEAKAPLEYPVAEEVAARRELELEALSQQSLREEGV